MSTRTLTAAFAVSIAACTFIPDEVAEARLVGPEGGTLTGRVLLQFVIDTSSNHVEAEVSGAPPGLHGLQLVEPRDCADLLAGADAPHWNPDGAPEHGGPDSPVRHAGDFGNVEVGADGTGLLRIKGHGWWTVAADPAPRNLVGQTIVLRERADDLVTQPDGNAGPVIACGQVVLSD